MNDNLIWQIDSWFTNLHFTTRLILERRVCVSLFYVCVHSLIPSYCWLHGLWMETPQTWDCDGLPLYKFSQLREYIGPFAVMYITRVYWPLPSPVKYSLIPRLPCGSPLQIGTLEMNLLQSSIVSFPGSQTTSPGRRGHGNEPTSIKVLSHSQAPRLLHQGGGT